MTQPQWTMPYIILLLLSASLIDLKKGKIPNFIWLGFLPTSRILSLLTLREIQPLEILRLSVALIEISIIAVILWKLGFYGGADMKAVISLGSAFPHRIEASLLKSPTPVWVPLSTLVNASIISMIISPLIRRRARLSERQGIPFFPFLTCGFILSLTMSDPFTLMVYHTLTQSRLT